jgi:hypothetical protein
VSATPKTDAAVEWATFRPGPISSIAEFARSLERENAELRKALQDAEVLASYTREDGKRQWVTLGEWLRPGQCIVLMDLADIDTYRTKEGAAP